MFGIAGPGQRGMRRLARAVVEFADASALAFAIVTVGFAIAAAHRTVDPGAHLRLRRARSGLIGGTAFCGGRKVAEQRRLAPCATPAADRTDSAASGICGRRHGNELRQTGACNEPEDDNLCEERFQSGIPDQITSYTSPARTSSSDPGLAGFPYPTARSGALHRYSCRVRLAARRSR